MAQNGSGMSQNGQKLTKMAKNDWNGQKLAKMAKNEPKWPKMTKMTNSDSDMTSNGPKWLWNDPK